MQIQLPGEPRDWLFYGMLFVLIIIAGALLLAWALRRILRRRDESGKPADEFAPPSAPVENQAAFAAASMQAVIKRLRDQEKELERLHRLEKERAEQTERLSDAVTRSMPTGLLLVNAAGLITNANPAAQAVLGGSALAYHSYSEALGTGSALAGLLSRCLRESATFQREEIEHATTDGRARTLGVTISPIFATSPPGPPAAGEAPGRVSGALCLLSDLTELTALQKQVRLKENLAALGEMSAGIAHEFKNALATISGYAQMIRSEASGPDLAENADKILQESRTLTHVVTEFLRFARPVELASEIVPLAPLVERVAADVSQALPSVRITTDGEFAEVTGDEGLLRQALLNLTRNAAEAACSISASGGGDSREGSVRLQGAIETDPAHGRWVAQRISISDDGAGIQPEDLPKVFLPFYTTKSNGTGLGLAIVQKIVLQHGGSIQARNRPEGGAEFILWLPIQPRATWAVDSPPARI